MDDWLKSHLFQVPHDTVSFCGDLFQDARVLNVGCGEMLSDFGFLNQNPRHIMGLDVGTLSEGWLEKLADKIRSSGYDFPSDYADRIGYKSYNGTIFPFDDNTFDFVFSWSAFEHIADIRTVLREMHRVVTPEGHTFVQVFPWFGNRHGSHLNAWIKKPYFQHTEHNDWVKYQLERYVTENPHESKEFIIDYMFQEYTNLNRESGAGFYEAARDAGFEILKARIISYDEDLRHAPRGVDFNDLMICGTLMLMKKGRSSTAKTRTR